MVKRNSSKVRFWRLYFHDKSTCLVIICVQGARAEVRNIKFRDMLCLQSLLSHGANEIDRDGRKFGRTAGAALSNFTDIESVGRSFVLSLLTANLDATVILALISGMLVMFLDLEAY